MKITITQDDLPEGVILESGRGRQGKSYTQKWAEFVDVFKPKTGKNRLTFTVLHTKDRDESLRIIRAAVGSLKYAAKKEGKEVVGRNLPKAGMFVLKLSALPA